MNQTKSASVALALFCMLSATARADKMQFSEDLQRAYAANNRSEMPLISWMDWGIPHFLLYSDGTAMVRNSASKSRLLYTVLNREDLDRLFAKVTSQDDFWSLLPEYRLTRSSDMPFHKLSLRVGGREEKSVMVYGDLVSAAEDQDPPPKAFVSITEALASSSWPDMKPWDPGYVEILWADYDYAPWPSVEWPEEWPDFDSPFVRPMTNVVIRKIMIFPTSELPALDMFFASRPEKSAVLISGRKMSGKYRWPLRAEKNWSSWNQ